MENWIELTPDEYRYVWDKFSKDFKFNPSGIKQNSPTFTPIEPFIVFDISHLYGNNFTELYQDLEQSILKAFCECMDKIEYLYVLDWQHTSYLFNPYLDSTRNEFDELPIPLYPNGDYYLFLNKTMSWGYLAHPWEQTITLFGHEIIIAVGKYRPKLFSKVIKRSKGNREQKAGEFYD